MHFRKTLKPLFCWWKRMVKSHVNFTFRRQSETLTKITLFRNAKSRCENIIKPVVYGYFWMHFTKTVQKDAKKHDVSHYSLMRFGTVANHNFPLEGNAIWRRSKTQTQNTYKHCRLWRLLEPLSGNNEILIPKFICFYSIWECYFAPFTIITFS